jgi:hypothetical protein
LLNGAYSVTVDAVPEVPPIRNHRIPSGTHSLDEKESSMTKTMINQPITAKAIAAAATEVSF